ncbi:MAG: hypothetical protein RBT11_20130 [Desulfobacterales bacterium]|jgi:hypothetical protein|nr:hypothetical protein [Desulfobacterales bacterium]
MNIHYITKTNRSEAAHVARIILNLYKEAVTIHGGIGHNQFATKFDAFKFLQCEIEPPFQNQIDLDTCLLREGASISLLCRLFDTSMVSGMEGGHQDTLLKQIKQSLNSGAFDNVSLAKDAILFAFVDRDIFLTKLRLVYEEYVLGYFYKIVSAHSKLSDRLKRPLPAQ